MPIFSWVEYPDKKTRDAANKKMSEDPSMGNTDMPFDSKRMFGGGFELIVDELNHASSRTARTVAWPVSLRVITSGGAGAAGAPATSAGAAAALGPGTSTAPGV